MTKGDITRANIVKTAHRLFVSQGYHRTSMRQIAEKASIALGGIYNHFPNKEKIFEAVFIEYHPYNEILPIILNSSNDNTEQFIRDSASHMINVLNKRPDFLNLMFIEMVEFRNIHSSKFTNNEFPKGLEFIRSRLQFREKRLKDIPPVILVRTFIGLFFSYFITDIFLGKNSPELFGGKTLDYLVDIYLHGILNGEKI